MEGTDVQWSDEGETEGVFFGRVHSVNVILGVGQFNIRSRLQPLLLALVHKVY